MAKPEHTLVVLDNDYEHRVYYRAASVPRGLVGWSNKDSEALVYRLDEEASQELTLAMHQIRKTDPPVFQSLNAGGGLTMTHGQRGLEQLKAVVERLWRR